MIYILHPAGKDLWRGIKIFCSISSWMCRRVCVCVNGLIYWIILITVTGVDGWCCCTNFVQIHCIKEIEQRGLSEVGIYRVPGCVHFWRNSFDICLDFDLWLVEICKMVTLWLAYKSVGFRCKWLRFLGHQISWMSDWVCSFSPRASSAMEVGKETKFGTKVA